MSKICAVPLWSAGAMLPPSTGEAVLRPCPQRGCGRQKRKHGLRTPKIHFQRTGFIHEPKWKRMSLTVICTWICPGSATILVAFQSGRDARAPGREHIRVKTAPGVSGQYPYATAMHGRPGTQGRRNLALFRGVLTSVPPCAGRQGDVLRLQDL